MPDPTYILPLNSPHATLAAVGGKGASLSHLARGGFPVPSGFHVTTDAYDRFVSANDLQARILALAAVPAEDPTALDRASEAIQALFNATPVPGEIAAAIRAAYGQLDDTRPVAVRSSATAEDLPGASFAGQQETYLNIMGAERVLEAIRRCWASLWTARAIAYRARNGIAHDSVALAVVVQVLVPAEAAGILFTANAVTGRRGEVVIDGAWGLGEAVVGGEVTPDHWIVDKKSGRILTTEINAKAVMTVRTEAGTMEAPVPEGLRLAPVLNRAQVVELARLGAAIEQHYDSRPQDIEWALADGGFHILQSRPITSLFPQPAVLPADGDEHVYLNLNFVQGMLEPFSPAGLSFFRDLARALGRATGVKTVADDQPAAFNSVAGRIFVDVTGALRSPRGSRILDGVLSRTDPQMLAALRSLDRDLPMSAQPDPPLLTTLARLRFLLPFLRQVLPRVVALWAAPDGARARFLREENGLLAALHDRIASAHSLDERVALLDDAPSALGVLAPRLLALAFSGVSLQLVTIALVERWLGDEVAVLDLLRGVLHNPTTTMDLMLSGLARHIAADPAAAAAFRAPTPDIVAAYRAGTLPPTARAALGTFLAVYGHRGIREIDIGMPRWSEEPGYIIDVIRSYLDVNDPALAPDRHFQAGAIAAEGKTQALLVRAAAFSRGRIKGAVLRVLVQRMRALVGLREMPKFFIIRAFAELRALWHAIGRDLVTLGRLDDASDVFYLTRNELHRMASGSTERLADRVAERRAAYMAELRRRRVPRVIASDGLEIYGGAAAGDSGALQGTSASPGVAEGPVRVILDPHRAHLAPGEILVAPSTDPAWTPLFLTAGGLIMEAGGVMSHGSVVAREYGIPAVVGVAHATDLLRTGQRVVVDGSTGRVTPAPQLDI